MQVWIPERKLGFASLSSTLGGFFSYIFYEVYKIYGKMYCITDQSHLCQTLVNSMWKLFLGERKTKFEIS